MGRSKPKRNPVWWASGDAIKMTLSGLNPKVFVEPVQATKVLYVCITPFGWPVVPEV